MGYDFNGKVALVTGGANGIGLCLVKEFLALGVKGVIIADINGTLGEQAVKELGSDKTCFIKTDVTNARQLEDSFKLAFEKYNGLDIVCNNAGVFDEKNWEHTIAVNVNAVVQGTLLSLKYMGKNNDGQGGVILTTASIYGIQPAACAPTYSGTKHFVNNFVRAFGTPFYYNLTGVKLVTFCPGITETGLPQGAHNRGLQGIEGISEYMNQQFSKLIPQTAEHAAKGGITAIVDGENGSTWVVEGGNPAYEVKPHMPTTID